ncbi:Recombination repair protein 1 [Papilio xuthus]|uniref:DNA-(apurinic or apyrimidinic site) endonuclease n=1 Tax=Papilio xuthus TaxID=66420 RepID=A0A194Q6J6_PAPXU|nr:Recombination repair protein 1 [Papilio xuthus]
MAPRSAKGKKAADVKVAESAPAKKGRKGKQVAEPEPTEAEEVKTTVVEKKTKRGKKAKDEEIINGDNEEVCPPAKKSKKKISEDKAEEQSNGDNSSPEEEPNLDEQNEGGDDESETNGHTEEAKPAGGRGRKKQTKKETVPENKPKETGRGRKNAKQEVQEDVAKNSEVVEEKPKPSGRGRGKKAQAKPSNDLEEEDKAESVEEEVKPEPPATKGKKKQNKGSKEKIETDAAMSDQEKEEEDIVEEEPKKKETKSRKNQGKKAQPKEQEDKEEDIVEDTQTTKKRRGAKKDDKSKDSKEEEEVEEKAPEVKPAKGKRGAKNAAAKAAEAEQDIQDTGESNNKRRRKAADDKAGAEDSKKKAPAKNKTATKYEDIDFSSDSKTSQGKDWNFKISSWNVDGIRAWMDKGGLEYIQYEKPDILCLQEIKCSKEKLPEPIKNVPGYHAYWLCSEQDGYAGVGIYTTKLAMNVQYGLQDEELDSEGRIITAEYEQFYLICTYVPNAGRKLVTLPKRLKWNEEFRKHVKSLDKKKPVIICGDMNVSHNEIDLANPKTNRKNAGFTEEERTGMTELLGDGFVDTYRLLYPDKTSAYTFWTYMFNCRAKNVGWRLDYFIVSERLVTSVCDSIIRDSVYGSDHCPVTLLLHLSSADKPKE